MDDTKKNAGGTRHSQPATMPKTTSPGRSADDFELNIPEELFDTSQAYAVDNLGSAQTFSAPRREVSEKSDSTRSYYSDQEAKQQKKEHKKRDKLKSIKNRRVFRVVWWAMVILVALTFASYLSAGVNDLFAIGRLEGKTQVVIPENVNLDQLTKILDEANVIATPDFFKLYCTATTKMEYFTAGKYTLRRDYDYEGLINFLQAGVADSREVEITFPEGLSVPEIAALLEENGVSTVDEILEACNSTDFEGYDMIEMIENESDKVYKLEGYLFPDTYTFTTDEALSSVLGKMLKNFQDKITVEMMEQITASDMSLDEIVVLASIIQAEAASNKDMLNVSAVLHNRLDFGAEYGIFTLGCDSTMFYPYDGKSNAPAGFEGKYDTYAISGLPAGAICNPGVAAIKAALNPNPEGAGYLYFCHSADGTPYYADTLDQHNANLVKAGLA